VREKPPPPPPQKRERYNDFIDFPRHENHIESRSERIYSNTSRSHAGKGFGGSQKFIDIFISGVTHTHARVRRENVSLLSLLIAPKESKHDERRR
jgi:hypothetical protein